MRKTRHERHREQQRPGGGDYKAEREKAVPRGGARHFRQAAPGTDGSGVYCARRAQRHSIPVLRMDRARREAALREQFASYYAMKQGTRQRHSSSFLSIARIMIILRRCGAGGGWRSAPGIAAAGGDPRQGVSRLLAMDFDIHRNGDVTLSLGAH